MTEPSSNPRPRVDQLTDDQLDQLYAALDRTEVELAALKTITTGYCPHCGRGDCSPTADQWAEQKQRADKAEAERDTFREVARSNYQHVRAIVPELEEAQAAIARVRAELDRIARLPTVDTTGPADSFSTGVRWVIRQLHENALDGTT